MSISYPAVTVAGGIITGGLIQRLGEGEGSLPLSGPESYGLAASESVRRLANRNYLYLRETWLEFAKVRARKGGAVTAKETRDKWLQILLRELGFDNLTPLPGGISIDERVFPVSHRWHTVPVHLLGWGTDLEHRSPASPDQAPHSMVQQLLNRSNEHLWAVLTNGQKLRLLRDSTSLSGIAHIEFDLDAIFDGELFPDFVLMFRLAHATRLAVRDPQTGAASCVMEEWRSIASLEGERALQQLRAGVEQALEILGTGFLDHPKNTALRTKMGQGLSEADFQRSLLRFVYRLLFWFVTEDRDLLLVPPPPSGAPAAERVAHDRARQRYRDYFSSRRLRDLAVARRHGRHDDLWQQVQVVFNALGDPNGRGLPLIAVPTIGGLFTTRRPADPDRGEAAGTWITLPLDEPLNGVHLTNRDLLRAVEALAVLPATASGRRRHVDFAHLGAEELGGVYEGLLEVQPRWDPYARVYHLERLAGNERKTTGSYYTPSSLVERLLDSALDPLLDGASAKPSRQERLDALLNLTVCDPACGSGHFLIAVARRIAKAYAAEETGEAEPTPEAVRHATRLVIGRCIYGVDVNDMAAELAKVSLWLEAMEPGKPLGYLDANIRIGDTLLGATPALLATGIPERAYAALLGDDRKFVAAFRNHMAEAEAGQLSFYPEDELIIGNTALAKAAEAIFDVEVNNLQDVHVQVQRAEQLDAARKQRMRVANAWCAAFIQWRLPDLASTMVTDSVLRRLQHDPNQPELEPVVRTVKDVALRYRLFHWHLEFPHIFHVPENGLGSRPAGWDGGFSLVIGNPPWEMVEIKDEEFFASRAPGIAAAANAAVRERAIKALETSDIAEERQLFRDYIAAIRQQNAVGHLVRKSGRYPLGGKGRINTYALFAETGRTILSEDGQLGMILPTGIATDANNQEFFRELVERRSLVALYDFENEEKVFPGVHHSVRFALLTLGGDRRATRRVSLAFRARQVAQIAGREYTLTPDEIALLNPNTGTCPVFVSRRDADIVVRIHHGVPVLWRDQDGGNPWNAWFRQGLFNMATDSRLFRTEDQLTATGWRLAGNVFYRDGERMLPLYEAKMVHYFDHRFSTYEGATEAQLKVGTLPRLPTKEPSAAPKPRYWVSERGTKEVPGVENRLAGKWKHGWLLGWRDVARSIDSRTLIAGVIPLAAVGHTMPIATAVGPIACLTANLSVFVIDYVTRQKLSGTHLTFVVMKQLPVLPPERYDARPPWAAAGTLDGWVTARVLELTYTAYDIEAYARDLGDQGAPFRWVDERRAVMRAELDAAYFHLYGIDREDIDYIMDTFEIVRYRDEKAHDEYRTKRLILERYDAMATAIRTGKPYETPLNPPPGHGPRHPARLEQ